MSLAHFTPVTGLIGGGLIGLSAATLLLFNGNVLGASGLMASFVVAPKKALTDPSQQWKLAFLATFFFTARLYVAMVDPDALKDERSDLRVVSPLGFIIGGFCVGFGTRLGNGCTTGHGICGLARLSTRSLAAVLTFMATGVLSSTGCGSDTCPFQQYLRESYDSIAKNLPTETTITIGTVIASLLGAAALPGLLRKAPVNAATEEKDEHTNNKRKIIPAILSGAFFSVGLVVSQMSISSKIYGFLDVGLMKKGTWDPTLMCVMGGGLIVSFISYQWVKGFNALKNTKALECPLSQKSETGHFDVPTSKLIDWKLIVGEALFGIGWGMAGLCPGPAMFLLVNGYPNVMFRWWPMFYLGSYLAEKVKKLSLKVKQP